MSAYSTTSVMILSAEARDQHVIFDILDSSGFEAIYHAKSTQQAREQLDEIPVGLLIADLELGAEDIDEMHREYEIPVAIAIAKGKGAAKRIDWDQIPAGFDECVRSPVDPDELIFRLRRFLDRPVLPEVSGLVQARLDVLSRCASGRKAEIGEFIANLGAELDMEYVTVISTPPRSTEMMLVASWGREEPLSDVKEVARFISLRQVLKGIPIFQTQDENRKRPENESDFELKCLVGVPLWSSDGKLRGALFAGATATPADWNSALGLLEGAAGRIADWLEMKRLHKENRRRGLQDTLTLLPNRLLFNDRLSQALTHARRTGEMFSLMFVDLDRFKNINDSLGHDVGDAVLKGVSKRLKGAMRDSDTVARYAGDEFTVIMRNIAAKEDVLRTADKLNRILGEPLPVEGNQELHITASIGISFFPDDGDTAELLLKRADMAMYDAKGKGRNNSQQFVRHKEDAHQQQLMLESKLRLAEENRELRVFYQPQVSAETEDIVGMEALIRWEHPELGLISPGFFVPLAEESGLIVSMGRWLLREACKETVKWQERFGLPLTLGVNLSPLQLKEPDLFDVVVRALDDSGLHPQYLDLEVTESLNIKSIPGLRETLTQLRNIGCRISIDDFGTGQSSLDYLKRFPADRIKIDQAFVRNIGVDPDDEAIVRATIDMAHQLNMEVVAEGVEQEDHLAFLRDHGCDELQGFLFCRPLSTKGFRSLLDDRESLASGQVASLDPA